MQIVHPRMTDPSPDHVKLTRPPPDNHQKATQRPNDAGKISRASRCERTYLMRGSYDFEDGGICDGGVVRSVETMARVGVRVGVDITKAERGKVKMLALHERMIRAAGNITAYPTPMMIVFIPNCL